MPNIIGNISWMEYKRSSAFVMNMQLQTYLGDIKANRILTLCGLLQDGR